MPDARDTLKPAAAGSPRRLLVFLGFVAPVLVLVAVAYWPARAARARGFDDGEYLLQNRLVQQPSWDSVRQFFAEVLEPSSVGGYYQPLAMTSLMLDVARGGGPDHVQPFRDTSLALHLANTLLVSLILLLLFENPPVAAAGALLWGLHPVNIEPVSWLSERKTLLAGLFAFASLATYVHFARHGRRWAYAASVALFLPALLSKPTVTPLPLLLIVLDWWPLRRLRWRTLAEKLPYIALAAAAAVITYISQARTSVVIQPDALPLWRGPLLVAHNVAFYLGKLVWPATLTPFYEMPQPLDWSHPAVRGGLIVTAALLIAVVVALRWTRAFAAALLFLVLGLAPVMGVVRYTSVVAADKYLYLPLLGVIVLVAAALDKGWRAVGSAPEAIGRRAGLLIGVTVFAAALGLRAHAQAQIWRDDETLYRHTVAHAPGAWQLRAMLGHVLFEQRGLRDEARAQWTKAVELNPGDVESINSLGRLLAEAGDPAEAVGYFERAVQLDPNYPPARLNLGRALAAQGRNDDARTQFEQAVQCAPEDPEAQYAYGVFLARQSQLEAARERLERTLELDPRFVNAYVSLSMVRRLQGALDDAEQIVQRGLQVAPGHALLLQERQVLERLRSAAPGGP